MSGWYFALGCLAGSVWTLVTRRVRVPSLKSLRMLLRPQYVRLTVIDAGYFKIQAIKEIRNATGYGLKEAKDASEGKPFTLDRNAARELLEVLRSRGVTVAAEPTRKVAA